MSSQVKQIMLLRHGMTDWNDQGKYQGGNDIPINERGRQQALACRQVIKQWQPQEVWVSSLSRALETALLATEWPKDRMKISDGLKEICFGQWENLTRAEIASRWADEYYRWGNDPETATPPDGESFSDVRKRVARVLSQIAQSPGKRCLIVSHGGTLRALLAEALNSPSRAVWRFCLGNCSFTGLELYERDYWLSFVNDCRHLSQAGLCYRTTLRSETETVESLTLHQQGFNPFERS